MEMRVRMKKNDGGGEYIQRYSITVYRESEQVIIYLVNGTRSASQRGGYFAVPVAVAAKLTQALNLMSADLPIDLPEEVKLQFDESQPEAVLHEG